MNSGALMKGFYEDFFRGLREHYTDDARADMKRIQEMYEEMHLTGKHKEMYVTK